MGEFFFTLIYESKIFQKIFCPLLKLWKEINLYFTFCVTAEIPLSRTGAGGDKTRKRRFEKKVGFYFIKKHASSWILAAY